MCWGRFKYRYKYIHTGMLAFPTIKLAAQYHKVSVSTIRRWCLGTITKYYDKNGNHIKTVHHGGKPGFTIEYR